MKAAPSLLGEKVLLIRRQSLARASDLEEPSKARVSDFTKIYFPLIHPSPEYQGFEIK